MKKTLKFAAIAAAALSLTSCGLGSLFDGLEEISAEMTEISIGNLFQIESATVEYNDGSVLYFKDYGKTARVDLNNGTSAITTDGKNIVLDHENKQYSEAAFGNNGDYSYSVAYAYIFLEKSLRYAAQVEGTLSGFVSETETVCGKSCTVFSFTNEDGSKNKVGGWKRIALISQTNAEDSSNFEATSIKESVNDSVFKVPAGYTKVESAE